MEAKSREQSKIRKRGNSSSSSSSVINKYRFKRAILVGKRTGSTTPVPTWKTTPKIPSLALPNSNSANLPPLSTQVPLSVSARKLAATFWEFNTAVPSPISDIRKIYKLEKFPHLSDPSYTPISEKMDGLRGGNGNGDSRRKGRVVPKEKLDLVNYSSLMEIETYTKAKPRRGCTEFRLKNISNGLKASKELLKVLNRVWRIDEQNPSAMSLVSALSFELDRARIQVNLLIKERQYPKRDDLDYFSKQFEEEKAAWKRKEREIIRKSVKELEVEKKLRRQAERLNKKLGKELADKKESLLQASKEINEEKRAKEILEQMCDELARGVDENRAQAEELKRESAKAREEVEKERQMLQLADVLREERVRMKLSEAKYHFEEKNAAVERLRNELEAYIRQKVGGNDENGEIEELEAYLREIEDGSCEKAEIKPTRNEEIGDNDSADSDLHSIELNMDNSSKSYKWSYANDANDDDDDLKRDSIDRDFKGRKSISEHIQWRSICLQRETPISKKDNEGVSEG